MDYTLLTDAQRQQISLRKLLDLEAEHCGMDLDIRLALFTGVDNDNVLKAQQQLALLDRQINLLRAWTLPPGDDDDPIVTDDDRVSSNGQELIEAE